ncbi:MAG: response regulator transcription factor [Chloroflexi bacterium]|nr:response regulator transcription factor [Chloroflexota bacterium]
MPPITVLLADDHHVVREGLATIVDLEDDMTVVGQAGDGVEAVRLTLERNPDVVLMDLQMPNLDGTQAIQHIRRERPNVRVLILTTFANEDHVLAGINAGAHGYLLKDATPEQLLQSIRAVSRGEAVLGSMVAATVLTKFRSMIGRTENTPPAEPSEEPPSLLTPRERDVLSLLAQGMSNQSIADTLVVSVPTVKVHVSNILEKLGASNRTEAVADARRLGLLTDGKF